MKLLSREGNWGNLLQTLFGICVTCFWISTSEHPEEAVDASAENLERMKEESSMLDVETLMRYIRIFSELSTR